MNKQLLKIGIRHLAVYLPETNVSAPATLREPAANLAANLARLGFQMDETLLHRINSLSPADILSVYNAFRDTLQVKQNWTPLVKGWDVPTNEKRSDHWITVFANMFRGEIAGERLACGHLIPFQTFPLERYNGCPYCGKPFETRGKIYTGQGSDKKVLTLWTDANMQQLLADLLAAKTAPDATQADSLNVLLLHYPLPDVEIEMKETLMLVIDTLKATGKASEAGKLLQSPADILRYLWYKHTGFLQIVQPSVIVKRIGKNNTHIITQLSAIHKSRKVTKDSLKLKYGRAEARMVARWINDLPMSAAKAAEMMHPKREIWVRFIRALRLAEFSQQKGMERLKELLDVFYHKRYEVWAGKLENARLQYKPEESFSLLQERPGQFARSLFSNMLWFGKEETLQAFGKVSGQIPARLLFTLNSYAENYFVMKSSRMVKPLGGVAKCVKPNKLLALYNDTQRQAMRDSIEGLCLNTMSARFAAQVTDKQTMYIDPSLHYLPLPIGERSETLHDLPAALMGTRFPLEGDKVRLFMQWGKGLTAQHLDMDLSCAITFDNRNEVCSYSQLTATGAMHSGDIREVPHKVGTAEYIELDLTQLKDAGARYVVFTCNAYSNGAITPGLVTGWMNSAYPMRINRKTGVAYDPSCVQHQVRITQQLTKGLVFGVLEVAAREIIWLEQAFDGQTVATMNVKHVKLMLSKLASRTTIGALLALKAKAQGMTLVKDAFAADEPYTREWARNTAAVSQLLTD